MLDLDSVMDANIPAANPLDIQRFWSLQFQHSADSSVGYSTEAILEICASQSADPIVVWARTALVGILQKEGLLDEWLNDEGLSKLVFETAAVFPLPNGLHNFDPGELLATLRIRKSS